MIDAERRIRCAAEERRRRRHMSAWTWCTLVLVLLILAGEAAWFGKLWGEVEPSEKVLPLSSPSGQGETTPGLAMTLYRGADFERPIEMRVLEGELRFPLNPELGEGIPWQNLSIRMSGRLIVPKDGDYRFFLHCDDAARLVVGDQLVHNAWPRETRAGQASEPIPLEKGTTPVLLEVRNDYAGGWIGLEWAGPGIARRYLTAQDFIADPHSGVAP